MKKAFKFKLAVIVVSILIVFSSPVRAIKIAAITSGCNRQEVASAEFEKVDTISMVKSVWRAKNTSLCDELTGAGHSTWYIYKVVFVNIPQWAGNG